jgi:hypothetical protein
MPPELLAQFNRAGNNANNQAFMAGALLGHLIAIVLCFTLPLVAGVYRGQPALGVFGAVVSAGAAIPFACLSGLPVALTFVVVFLTQCDPKPKRARRRNTYDDDEDDDRPRRRRRSDEDDEYDDHRRRREW